jgi:hypothetical protein
LANIYLHHVFDLWTRWWRNKRAGGEVIVVRYADDFIVGFERKDDAERYKEELAARMRKFKLELHPDKTRLLAFGRKAAKQEERGEGEKPGTFDFLGFTHMCGKARNGGFLVKRHTIPKRMRGKLKEVKAELQRRKHDPIPEVGKWLGAVVSGHTRYYGVPTNQQLIYEFRSQVGRHWHRTLKRRSQENAITWGKTKRFITRYLPPARVCHPFPDERFVGRTRGKSLVW